MNSNFVFSSFYFLKKVLTDEVDYSLASLFSLPYPHQLSFINLPNSIFCQLNQSGDLLLMPLFYFLFFFLYHEDDSLTQQFDYFLRLGNVFVYFGQLLLIHAYQSLLHQLNYFLHLDLFYFFNLVIIFLLQIKLNQSNDFCLLSLNLHVMCQLLINSLFKVFFNNCQEFGSLKRYLLLKLHLILFFEVRANDVSNLLSLSFNDELLLSLDYFLKIHLYSLNDHFLFLFNFLHAWFFFLLCFLFK